MSVANIQYWPFPPLSSARGNERYDQTIRFLEEAHAAGFRAGMYTDVMPDWGEYLAESESGRSGWIFYRGSNRWELGLSDQKERVHGFWTDDFGPAAAAVLVWLRGGTAADVSTAVEGHVIRGAVIVETAPLREPSAS